MQRPCMAKHLCTSLALSLLYRYLRSEFENYLQGVCALLKHVSEIWIYHPF